MNIQYVERKLTAVVCSQCESEGPDSLQGQTGACDAAKDEGWKIEGNAEATCPACVRDEEDGPDEEVPEYTRADAHAERHLREWEAKR